MQTHLEPLYAPIRSKLAHALQRWHPSDSSARLILQPWKDVFTLGAWEAFMVKNIVPKLGMCSSFRLLVSDVGSFRESLRILLLCCSSVFRRAGGESSSASTGTFQLGNGLGRDALALLHGWTAG